MNKLQMAHEYAMEHVQEGFDINYDVLVVEAWQYADAMQSEADKREPSGFPNVLRGACGEIVAVKVDDKEWQPDWSQAPADATYWTMRQDGKCLWWKGKPLFDGSCFYDAVGICHTVGYTPSFGYTGDWRESLRKR